MRYELGICQMMVTEDRARNLQIAGELVHEAAAGGAQVVMLRYHHPNTKDTAQTTGKNQRLPVIFLRLLRSIGHPFPSGM